MIVNVYSVKDYHAGFNAPTFEGNDAVAMRNFANACLVESSLLHNFVDDFELWCIGQFDSDLGQLIVSPEYYHPVCKASDFVKREVKPSV